MNLFLQPVWGRSTGYILVRYLFWCYRYQ